ncbi:MAG: aldo/keto reductase [Actinobacteria bacterium]|nr:aldo/keto reductase [Actinomycetota bacterium]
MGVSIYELEDAINVVNSGLVDYIQVPYSILDQRINSTDFFEQAQKNNVTVFTRSAFLQGLIMMEDGDIPDHLSYARNYLKMYNDIINEYGISRLEGAIHFVYDNNNIDYLVFGVDNKEQLIEDI